MSVSSSVSILLKNNSFLYSSSTLCAKYQQQSVFWKQRLWSRMFPVCSSVLKANRRDRMDGSENGKASITTAILTAICTFVVGLPTAVVAGDIDDLVIMLVQALTVTDAVSSNPSNTSNVSSSSVSSVVSAAVPVSAAILPTNTIATSPVTTPVAVVVSYENNISKMTPTLVLRKCCLEAFVAILEPNLDPFSKHVNSIIPALLEVQYITVWYYSVHDIMMAMMIMMTVIF